NITDAENSAIDAQKAYDSYVQTNVANLTRADIAAQKDRLLWNVQKAQTNLDNIKLQTDASIATARNNVTTAQNSLQSAQTNLAQMKDNPPAIQQKQSAVATARAALDKAREDQANITTDPVAVQQRKSQVATAKAILAKAQEDLATIQAGPDTQDIDLKQIQVDNAQVALDDVKEQLQRATIVAPFDGVVASVGATAGDQVPVNTNTVIVVLVDTTKAEVDATVDEIDVAKVKAGQTAAITLDAIQDAMLRGTVTAVSPIAQTQSGVVTYKLSIAIMGGPPPGSLSPDSPPSGGPPPGRPPLAGSGGRPDMAIQNPRGYDLKAGMTASANIIVENKPDVLLVPSSAITRNGRDSVVQVVIAEGKTEQRVVQTGATNGTQTEIVSGLTEGEKVVIATTIATTSSQNSGMFRMFGPGGPPPGGGGGRPPG
ncbi:MAG: HlyD family efflux transporter periplasmic adaptor subunit, partial [Dehalococcoidia bacterium]